jgi:hypothetical protein
MNFRERWQIVAAHVEKPVGLASLLCFHAVVYCLALFAIARFKFVSSGAVFSPSAFHLFFDPSHAIKAVAATAAFALTGTPFLFARFSFGYLIGFYLYTMLLGFIWLNCFSDLDHDHLLAGLSAAASAIAFLSPAVLIVSPAGRTRELSPGIFEHLLTFILLQALVTIVIAGVYNFRFVAIEHIYDYRDKLEFPRIVAYMIALNTSMLLPFAFACFSLRGNFWRAGLVLLLGLLFYPVTLSKLAIFAPAWLLFLLALGRFFGTRTAVLLSLFLPLLAGNLAFLLGAPPTIFNTLVLRMLIIPSGALDIYNHYFLHHDLTHFCQIGILKSVMPCAYAEPLSLVMREAYGLGNLNASLFATEGIASVGPYWAPVSAFACGLVVALGNRLSAGLPSRFVLISAGILPLIFQNVPFSTVLLTHGLLLLFALWYVTPRTMFQLVEDEEAPAAGK